MSPQKVQFAGPMSRLMEIASDAYQTLRRWLHRCYFSGSCLFFVSKLDTVTELAADRDGGK